MAVCAAVGVLARPDLPDVVRDVHAEVFQLFGRFVPDTGGVFGEEALRAGEDGYGFRYAGSRRRRCDFGS